MKSRWKQTRAELFNVMNGDCPPTGGKEPTRRVADDVSILRWGKMAIKASADAATPGFSGKASSILLQEREQILTSSLKSHCQSEMRGWHGRSNKVLAGV